jgi:hypothetical protein
MRSGVTYAMDSAEVINVDEARFRALPVNVAIPSLVLGGEQKGPHDAFASVRGVAVGEDGEIFVLDGLQRRVAVFDASGDFVRFIAHEGDGPGEIRALHGFPTYTTGGLALMQDSLHILGKHIYTFNSLGEFIANSPSWIANTWQWNGLAATDAGVMVEQEYMKEPRTPNWQQAFSFRLYDAHTGQIGKPLEISFPVQDYGGSIAGTLLLAADPAWSISRDVHVYHVEGDSFDIVVQNLNGTVTKRYLSKPKRIRTVASDVEQAIRAMEQASIDIYGHPASPELRKRMRSGPHAKWKPAIRQIIVSDEGNIAVERMDISSNPYGTRDSTSTMQWEVLSVKGNPLLHVVLPNGFIPKQFRKCQLYGTAYGSDDQPIVMRFDLNYPKCFTTR